MSLELLQIVGLVITMSAVEFEDASVGVLAVCHMVKPHVAIATLVTGVGILSSVNLGVVLQSGFGSE